MYAKQRYVLGAHSYEERGTLFVARVDGSAARRLADGIYPDVSPDGRWVVFRRSSESTDLLVMETAEGEPRVIARRAGTYDWARTPATWQLWWDAR